MSEDRPTSIWRDERTGKVIARLHSGSWPQGLGPEETIRRHRPVDVVERTLTGPEREARARALLPKMVAAVEDLRHRVLAAGDTAEGRGDLDQIVEVVGSDVVSEVGRLRGSLAELQTAGTSQHVARAAAATDRAWGGLPRAVGLTRRDRGAWTSAGAARDLANVALHLGETWAALHDAAPVLGVEVAAPPVDRSAEAWWDRAEEAAAALASASGMVNRAVGPARRASSDQAGAAAALEALELEALRLSNMAGQLAAEVSPGRSAGQVNR